MWVYNPQGGGNKIPEKYREKFRHQADFFSKTRSWSSAYEIILRFKSQFCYLDALKKGELRAFPIGRLRYFRDNAWSLAFYAYSSEAYEPCLFNSGKWEGTLEEGILACEVYLDD